MHQYHLWIKTTNDSYHIEARRTKDQPRGYTFLQIVEAQSYHAAIQQALPSQLRNLYWCPN